MSEIIQNISDIFFAIYTPADYQELGRRPFLSVSKSRMRTAAWNLQTGNGYDAK